MSPDPGCPRIHAGEDVTYMSRLHRADGYEYNEGGAAEEAARRLMAFSKTLDARDLIRLKRSVESFPKNAKLVAMAHDLAKSWKMAERTLQDWISIARAHSEHTISLFGEGKIGKDKLSLLAYADFSNPAHREFLVDKTIEEDITMPELARVRDWIYKGKHPLEAIDIVRNRRPEQSFGRAKEIELKKLVSDLGRDGIDWRRTCELIRMIGKIQMIQDGKFKIDLLGELAAMRVAVDDMSRYVKEIEALIPKEVFQAFVAEYREEPSPKEAPDPVGYLPAPKDGK